jgi:predicted branched-subunit amino acid permease
MNASYLVAAFGDNIPQIKSVVLGVAVVAVIVYLVMQIVKGNHRQAWHAVPLIAIVLVIGTAAGVTFLSNAMLSVLHFVFGSA